MENITRKRLITAGILIVGLLLLILKASPRVFGMVTLFITAAAAFEWAGLATIQSLPGKLAYVLFLLLIAGGALWLPIWHVMLGVGGWWLLATLAVLIYPRGTSLWGRGKTVRAALGVLTLVPCWVALNALRISNGPESVLFLFVLVAAADSGAWFVGKRWGTYKMLPLVSPGKTWQGFLGALLAGLIVVAAALSLSHTPQRLWLGATVLSLITLIFAVIGDLFESMLKRQAGVKDSGSVLPGHGGVLDRIDSITAAAPVFVLGAMWLGR